MTTHAVYWIHSETDTDPYSEGYIGVSNDVQRRIGEHRKSTPIVSQLLETGGIVEVLHTGLYEGDAYKMERQYRPCCYLGLNINEGGKRPPRMTREWLVGTANMVKGSERTERQKAAARLHSERMKGRTSPRKGVKLEEARLVKMRGPRPDLMKPKEKVICPHCGKIGGKPAMHRHHFDRCESNR